MVNKTDPLYILFEKFAKFGLSKEVYVPSHHAKAAALKQDPPIMDGPRFVKLCRDAGLIEEGPINTTEVDIVFNKVKGKLERRINFVQFKEALAHLAKKKFPDIEDDELRTFKMCDLVLACSGPTLAAVTVSSLGEGEGRGREEGGGEEGGEGEGAISIRPSCLSPILFATHPSCSSPAVLVSHLTHVNDCCK